MSKKIPRIIQGYEVYPEGYPISHGRRSSGCPLLDNNGISYTTEGVRLDESANLVSSDKEVIEVCTLHCPFEECVLR